MPIVSKTTRLEFTPAEIEKLIKAEIISSGQATLDDKITVSYTIQEVGGDFMDRHPGIDTVTKIVVTIEKKNV